MKILTYNVQHCASFMENHKIDFELFAKTILDFGADIIGLNEMRAAGEASDYQDQVGTLSRLTGIENSYFAKAIYVKDKGPYGNGLLSKFKIVSTEVFPVPDPNPRKYNGYYETRCLLKAKLECGLTVAIIHMGLNPDEQENAVKVVLENMEDEKFILMGDFNATPDSEVLRPIKERLFDTASLTEDPLLSFPSDKPEIKIDYIFTSHDIKVKSVSVPPLTCSDHRPYIIEIEDI